MAEVRLDLAHHRRIRAILEVLVADGADLAHAMLACKDAFITLGMGLKCGLPDVAAVLAGHRRLVQCEDASGVSECGKNASGEQCH